MREPPTGISDDQVLDVVRREWDHAVDRVEHLPIGFGAHHWRASAAGVARWFATLDRPTSTRPPDTYEAAYAAAHDLANGGLSFVLAGATTHHGRFTTDCGPGLLSVTPWQEGESCGRSFRDDAERDETTAMVLALHGTAPPPSLRPWSTVVDPLLVDVLRDRAAAPWLDGPLGEEARSALLTRIDAVAAWAAEHHRLLDLAKASRDRWVTTHGEPMPHNHLLTPTGRLLVDWESALLAPSERDTRDLVAAGAALSADPAMARLFDLEWRLGEVDGYSVWFAAPHTGTDSDRVALAGLLEELESP